MESVSLSRVEVPDIGDFDDVPVIEILVSVGDQVAAEDPLVTLESDKATMDVPAPLAGVVRELHVDIGDRVSQGTVLMSIEPSDGSTPSPVAPPRPEVKTDVPPSELAAPEAVVESSPPGLSEPPARAVPPVEIAGSEPAGPAPPSSANGGPIYASPSVRRLARELGVELSGLQGTGRKGRITPEDVRRRAEGGGATSGGPSMPGGALGARGATGGLGLDLPPWPSVDFEKYGPVERVSRSRIQRISAPNLARNWVMIPHVTHNDEADITELEAWRRQLNTEHASDDVKVTMVVFLIVASVATLKEFPWFNSSLDGDELVLKRYYNIGFAADTPGGLVVPVIKGADGKGLIQIARELSELSAKARAGKLMPADMSGATFTISSLGGIGGTSFTPIVNAPEVAILGATRSATKPVWDPSTESFRPRLMLPLSLSYDHRVIDGAAAARFVSHLSGVLADLRRVLL
jgi:pyruvate dehydrogenase E2 component (dihydrolipoamide acetyltransferase)